MMETHCCPLIFPPLRTLVEALCRPQSGTLWLSQSDDASDTYGGSSDRCAARAAYCSKTWTAGPVVPSSQLIAGSGEHRDNCTDTPSTVCRCIASCCARPVLLVHRCPQPAAPSPT